MEGSKPMKSLLIAILAAASLSAMAQSTVVPAPDQSALLSAATSQARANKRLVYDFWRDVLEGGHLENADKYLSEGYVQHNPNVPSGRVGFVRFFGQFSKPHPVADHIQAPVVAMIAEGDLVVVALAQSHPVPGKTGQSYSTTWFDMFRIEHGKIVEHWDNALLEK